MADVASDLKSWSTTAASNNPTDATTVGAGLADNLQELQKVVRQDLAHKGADIASATTTDLGAVVGLLHDITGTTTITSFGTVSAGIWKIIKFEGVLTLTHNASSLILPGAANITTSVGDVAIMFSEGSGNWRCVSYTSAAGLVVPRSMRGYIDGLTLSHASVSSVTIAAGIAMDSTQTLFMERTTSITKLLNAAWAEGSAAGGLDTGAEAANTWYYVHLIRKTSNGAIDALFSTSISAPTMPSGWVERRYIGAVFNNSGSDLRLFTQKGDTFTITSNPPPQDINATATLISASGTLFTMSVPPLAQPEAIFCAHFADSVTNYLYLTSPDQPDNTADPAAGRSHLTCTSTVDGAGMFRIRTNTSGQIRARGNNGTGGELYASTLGWVDLRGKDA